MENPHPEPIPPEPDSPQPEPESPKPRSLLRRIVGIVLRSLRYFLYVILFYFLVVLVGLIPVNNDFQPTPDGIEIFITSSSVHADLVVPIQTETIDWREHFPPRYFSGENKSATHAAIGWGDKGFYIGTPTWADLKVSTAANALFWPSDSCMHVCLCTPKALPEGVRSVKISVAQYKNLVDYIKKSFRKSSDGSYQWIPKTAYSTDDAFFQANGYYHCLNTCNCWVGGGMRAAGIRTAWFTPLPKTMFLYLPE